MATEFRYFTASPVTPIANTIFNDKTVGYKEVGLYTQLVYLGFIHEVGEWDFSAMGMTALHTDGRAAVRSGLENLENHGYLLRASRVAGARPDGEQVWVAFEKPDEASWLEVANQLAAEGCEPLGKTTSFHAWPSVDGMVSEPSKVVSARKFFPEAGNLHREEIPEAENQHREKIPEAENLHREEIPDAENQHRENFCGGKLTKPQVEAHVRKPASGKNSRSRFPAAGNRTQKYVYTDGFNKEEEISNPSIHTSDRFIGASGFSDTAPSVQTVTSDDMAAVMAEPGFEQAMIRMRAASKNRNRIKAAPAALADLVLQGIDPAEVADAWDDHVAGLKASGREPGMWTQLTKWLESEAADAVEERRYRSSAKATADKARRWAESSSWSAAPAVAPAVEDFDPATYGSTLGADRRASAAGAGADPVKVAFLCQRDDSFRALAEKVGEGSCSAEELEEFNRRVEAAPMPSANDLMAMGA